jgi:predicted DNA-binding transcriptional regulator YafY
MNPLDLIRAEARTHRTVVIDASEMNGTRETREIEPYSLRAGRNGVRLMFWCLKHSGWRGILVQNIHSAQATGRTFVPRYPVEL